MSEPRPTITTQWLGGRAGRVKIDRRDTRTRLRVFDGIDQRWSRRVGAFVSQGPSVARTIWVPDVDGQVDLAGLRAAIQQLARAWPGFWFYDCTRLGIDLGAVLFPAPDNEDAPLESQADLDWLAGRT